MEKPPTNSVEALKQEANSSRVYRTRTPMCDEISWHASDMKTRAPEVDWSDCCKLLKGPPAIQAYEIEVKHMIRWGRADASVIEKAFGVKLPDDVHAFYAHIQECVLNWKYSYQILNPKDVVNWERYHRHEEGAKHLPYHLIRFCKISGSSDSIAFRKHTHTGQWNIDYAAICDSTEELQSPKNDNTSLAEDLDTWMHRLMTSDGILHEEDRRITAVERVA